MRSTRRSAPVGLTAAALLLAACGGVADPLRTQSPPAPSAAGSAVAGGPFVVGSSDLTESQVIAELYAQALVAKGIESSTELGIGSRKRYVKALQDESVAVVPEYTGDLLLAFRPDSTATSADDVEATLPDALPDGLEILESSAAVDQDVYVVTQEFSDRHGVTSLADLARVSDGVVVAGLSGLEQRAYGPRGLTSAYGVKVSEFKPFDSPELMAEELKKGDVDVADLSTTMSTIGRNQLVQLADPQQLILPQHVVPLVRGEVAGNATATQALEAVQAALTTADLIALNDRVEADRQDPDQVAKEWLISKDLV